MFDFLKLVANFLPLCIKEIEWDGDSLIVSGDNWSFFTSSVWRVSRDKDMLFACLDDQVNTRIEELVGLSVVNISWIVSDQPIDPSLILSDGRRLDVFCSFRYEPWVMSLPNDNVYIGNS
ncbi:hypothetical protein [uncultured Salinicola sp.]|uniref:hypothetical protein n=1 Tax=uncultured Salinicola sp. TaxID=1193542 RepID=UPI002615EAC8|nr:hypothetical protein [uncultured Salinicola sp.]|tara:strand:- start:339 stop:698 length:360 start_codon:yes stop_codon:yes gene_type:complete